MSLEFIEEKVRSLFGGGGSGPGRGGRSVHEHAANQLLYADVWVDNGKRDAEGNPVLERRLDIAGRTELPNPSGTAVLVHYAKWLQEEFHGLGADLLKVNDDYMTFMVSKDRKGRLEYTQVAMGAAVAQQTTAQADVAKEVANQ